MQRAKSLEKTLMLRKAEGSRRKRQQRMTWLESISDSMDTSLSKLWETMKEGQGSVVCCSSWGHKESHMTEWLNNNMTKESSYWGKDNLVTKQHWKHWTAICKRMKLNTKIHSKWILKNWNRNAPRRKHRGKLLITVVATIFWIWH